MVKFTVDAPWYKNKRQISFSYDPKNENDKRILNLIDAIISDNQPTPNENDFCSKGKK